MQDIKERLGEISARIAAAAERSGRPADAVTLVAVSKQMPVERLREAYDAGVRVFGENHAQELRDKHPNMPADCRWHYIGRLQTNKIKYLINTTQLIQSVDSETQLAELARLCARSRTTADILVQINPAGERQKGGIPADGAEEFMRLALGYSCLRVRGLMLVAPIAHNPNDNRPYFKQMRCLFDRLGQVFEGVERVEMRCLSMGMSADFEVAIEEGSNMVRVGSALFGPRN